MYYIYKNEKCSLLFFCELHCHSQQFFHKMWDFRITGQKQLTFRNNFMENFLLRIRPTIDYRSYFDFQRCHPREGVTLTNKAKVHIGRVSFWLFPKFSPNFTSIGRFPQDYKVKCLRNWRAQFKQMLITEWVFALTENWLVPPTDVSYWKESRYVPLTFLVYKIEIWVNVLKLLHSQFHYTERNSPYVYVTHQVNNYY